MKKLLSLFLLFFFLNLLPFTYGQGTKQGNQVSVPQDKTVQLEKNLALIRAQQQKLKDQLAIQQSLIDTISLSIQTSDIQFNQQKDSIRGYCSTLAAACQRLDVVDKRFSNRRNYSIAGILLVLIGGLTIIVFQWMQRKKIYTLQQQIEDFQQANETALSAVNDKSSLLENTISQVKSDLGSLSLSVRQDIDQLSSKSTASLQEIAGKTELLQQEQKQYTDSGLQQVQAKLSVELSEVSSTLAGLLKKLEILEKQVSDFKQK